MLNPIYKKTKKHYTVDGCEILHQLKTVVNIQFYPFFHRVSTNQGAGFLPPSTSNCQIPILPSTISNFACLKHVWTDFTQEFLRFSSDTNDLRFWWLTKEIKAPPVLILSGYGSNVGTQSLWDISLKPKGKNHWFPASFPYDQFTQLFHQFPKHSRDF